MDVLIEFDNRAETKPEYENCPLCDGKAMYSEYFQKNGDDSYSLYPAVFCSYCGLTLFGKEYKEWEEVDDEEKQQLAKAWNKRVKT